MLFLVYLGSGSVYHLLFLLVVLSSYSLLSSRIAEWMGAFILAKSFFTVGLFRYFATLFAAYSPRLEPVPTGGEDDNPPGFGGGGLEMCLLPRRVLQAGNTTSFSWPWYLPFLSR